MKIRRSKKMMENYVCPRCWHQIHECTCDLYPPSELIMIDINIQDIIRILNKKGYQTRACCESHFGYSYSIYIAFTYDYSFEPPEGFNYAKSRSAISYTYKKNEYENKELFERIKAEKLKILLEWVWLLSENPSLKR